MAAAPVGERAWRPRVAALHGRRPHARSARSEEVDDPRCRSHRHPDALGVRRLRPGRNLGDHDLARAIDDEELAVDAVAEDERRGTIAHVPLATIAERQAGKVRGKVAGSPCVAITVASDVVDPALRNDLRAATRAPLNQQLTDAREIAD